MRRCAFSANMRTTVEIPDGIYRKAKAEAALRGLSFRSYLIGSLQKELDRPKKKPGKRLNGPLFTNQKPLISNEKDLAKILDEEDRETLS